MLKRSCTSLRLFVDKPRILVNEVGIRCCEWQVSRRLVRLGVRGSVSPKIVLWLASVGHAGGVDDQRRAFGSVLLVVGGGKRNVRQVPKVSMSMTATRIQHEAVDELQNSGPHPPHAERSECSHDGKPKGTCGGTQEPNSHSTMQTMRPKL